MTINSNWQLEEQSFWDFSLLLYAKPKVMTQCLLLQDHYQLNVNIMLFCCFAEQLQLSIDETFVNTLYRAALPSEQLIVAHRQKRKQYKQHSGVNDGEMFDANHYEQLKKEELRLEKQQQSDLITAANMQQAQLSLSTETNNAAPSIPLYKGLYLYASLYSTVNNQPVLELALEPTLSDALNIIQTANQSIKQNTIR